jgi:sigma-B regulation protein RsbU (phosphoserine phosphatase)
MRDWTFEAQEIFLAPGTTLFLYTDGLDEAEDAGRNLFGKDRIGKILQDTPADPRALIERMTQAVACFAGGTEQSDDLTMLALQWKK